MHHWSTNGPTSPKRHTVELTDTAPETVADMVTIGQRIARAAHATELADATNVVINDGRAPVRLSRSSARGAAPQR